jgi:hypothetical protein
VKVASVSAGVTTWVSPPLPAGIYFWAVTDRNSAGTESADSLLVEAVVVAAPVAPKVPGAPTFVTLSVTLTGTVP